MVRRYLRYRVGAPPSGQRSVVHGYGVHASAGHHDWSQDAKGRLAGGLLTLDYPPWSVPPCRSSVAGFSGGRLPDAGR